MSKTKAGLAKPAARANCAGSDLQKRIGTYPVRLTRPASLAGKEIHVERVGPLRMPVLRPSHARASRTSQS